MRKKSILIIDFLRKLKLLLLGQHALRAVATFFKAASLAKLRFAGCLILLATLTLSVSAVKYETTTELSEPSISGDGELETGDYDYIRAVSAAIQAKWQAPQPNQYPKDIYKQFKNKKLTDLNAIAEFTITPEGQVEDLSLKESTALPLFNESCLKAVRDAAPFPEPQRSKIIQYEFEYHYTHKNLWQRLWY